MVSTLSKSFVAAAAFGLLTLVPAQASAQGSAQPKCDLSIQPALDQWVIRYNPLEDASAQRTFDALLVNNGNTCSGDLLASLAGEAFGLTTPGRAGSVRYRLVDIDYGNVDITPLTGESARRNGNSLSIKKDEQKLVHVTFAAFPDAGVAQGRYTQNANLVVAHASGTIHATRPITLVLDVAAAAAIGIKGEFSRPNGTPVIDLGELTEGARPLNTALYVHSTGSYQVTVTSANAGRLRQGATAWYVDYNLKVGTQDINLQRTDTINVVSQTARHDDYPLTVRIGDVSGKRAGEYRDTLTFTVAAI